MLSGATPLFDAGNSQNSWFAGGGVEVFGRQERICSGDAFPPPELKSCTESAHPAAANEVAGRAFSPPFSRCDRHRLSPAWIAQRADTIIAASSVLVAASAGAELP